MRKRLIIICVLLLGCLILYLNSGLLYNKGKHGVKVAILDQDDVINQRNNFIQDRCAQLSSTKYWQKCQPSGNFLSYDSVTYCGVPKIGCTYWKRVLRFIAQDYTTEDRPILKPSDIDRYQVHFGNFSNLTSTISNSAFGILIMSTTKSFMFSRHPFTRLWSAYIDKFYLPDFWNRDAKWIGRKMRKTNQTCVSDLTFAEFLEFITKSPKKKLNPHWKPVHLVCSPCHNNFDVVGKLETFVQDRDFILRQFGWHGAIENMSKTDRIKTEVKTLVEYNLVLKDIRGNHDCYQTSEIAERLWHAFQINGYIHRNTTYSLQLLVERGFNKKPIRILTDVIFETIDSQKDDIEEELKRQKRDMMLEAYANIPDNVINKLKRIYKYDFDLFQYDYEI